MRILRLPDGNLLIPVDLADPDDGFGLAEVGRDDRRYGTWLRLAEDRGTREAAAGGMTMDGQLLGHVRFTDGARRPVYADGDRSTPTTTTAGSDGHEEKEEESSTETVHLLTFEAISGLARLTYFRCLNSSRFSRMYLARIVFMSLLSLKNFRSMAWRLAAFTDWYTFSRFSMSVGGIESGNSFSACSAASAHFAALTVLNAAAVFVKYGSPLKLPSNRY